MALLFEPITFRNVTLKNRIVVSPMCQYSSADGFATDWHLVHLGARATGGAGLIISEAAAISPEGRISPGDLGIWKDEHIPALKRITDFIKGQGCVTGIQLAHAGRKASHAAPWLGGKALVDGPGSWTTLAPSALAYAPGEPAPKEMTTSNIRMFIANFTTAAQRALDAGFELVEIHAAHGYLLHEFLSPLSNKRSDEYGGSFENRSRLLLETVNSIRRVIGYNIPLFVRISATDWVEGGWNEDDSVKLAKKLKEASVDLIDCSSGGNSREQKITAGPLYQVPFAEKLKRETSIAIGAVGMITTAQEAEAILQQGQADLIFLAREMLRDPYFPLHAARALSHDLKWPVQYERAK